MAFDIFQPIVDADPSHVREGRRRRDAFSTALRTCHDVWEVIPSGSLARRTQLDPIHDVDLILVFDESQHAGWRRDGGGGPVAALHHTAGLVKHLLGAANGTGLK